MSVFKRADWKSGLTYERVCDQCHTLFRYKDDVLGFRPWFADGFVYCPKCQKPLRHSEHFAIDAPVSTSVHIVENETMDNAFCTQCGSKFNENDRFCARCGTKR